MDRTWASSLVSFGRLKLSFFIFYYLLPLLTQSTFIDRCKWLQVSQPLSHFNNTKDEYFNERVCVVEDMKTNNRAPGLILFYCGNESPVDLYVNNSGFMFEFNHQFPKTNINLLLVFAEHRFFGTSMPSNVQNSLSFLTVAEALADYDSLISHLKHEYKIQNWPVVTFGGSYGGMLSSWFKYKYPKTVNTAIASSAPILGISFNHFEASMNLDGSSRLITKAVSGFCPDCPDLLKTSFVMMKYLSSSDNGRKLLSDTFKTCEEVSEKNVDLLLENIQSIFFLLSEGNYRFKSSYISSSVLTKNVKLPVRPLFHALSKLKENRFRAFSIQKSECNSTSFIVSIDDSGIKSKLKVNWDKISEINDGGQVDISQSNEVKKLLDSVFYAYTTLYNAGGDFSCIELGKSKFKEKKLSVMDTWQQLVCNDGLNLVQYLLQGIGNDFFWPPNAEYGYNETDVILHSLDSCVEKYGIKKEDLDPFGKKIEKEFGGYDILKSRNIFFTNGGYDPWMPAGVLPEMISRSNKRIKSQVLEQGAHHSELFSRHQVSGFDVFKLRASIKKFIIETAMDGENTRFSNLGKFSTPRVVYEKIIV